MYIMKQTMLGRFFSAANCAKVIPTGTKNTYEKMPEEPKKPEEPKITNQSAHRLYFDGCSKGNPGASGAGAVLYNVCKNDEYEIWADSCYVGSSSTNNEAEYTGLLIGMKEAIRRGIRDIDIYGDSQLVIKQMRGEYAVKSPGLLKLHKQVKDLELGFEKVRYVHVYRHKNTRADELSNEGLLKPHVKHNEIKLKV